MLHQVHSEHSNQSSEYIAGAEAANDIWHNCASPGYKYPFDPQTLDFAAGALAEFERLQRRDQKGMAGKIAAGAQAGAQQLIVEKWHGLIEVVQNADDLGATEVDFLLEGREDGTNILHMCHNGAPVLVQHVMAMTYAFVSTKNDDANATGRFGVGLKTLGRLGGTLEVHSGVYSFAIEGLRTTAIPQVPSLAGNFFDLARRDTLLSLLLDTTVDCNALENWFKELKSSLLLFLKSVRRVSFGFDTGKTVYGLELVPRNEEEIAPGIRRRILLDGSEENSIYERSVEVPSGMNRAGKATGAETTIAIAATDSCLGLVYATLPTRINTKMPFAFNADFDPGTSRENLLDTSWNIWLLEEVGRLVADVVINLFKVEPKNAWYLVPLEGEADCSDQWLKKQLQTQQTAAHAFIAQEARLEINNRNLSLSELCYTEEYLNGLLMPGDAELACPGKTLVPEDVCDDGGAYRVVLASFCASKVDLQLAFTLFDSPLTAGRSASWCARLVKLAINEKETSLLTEHLCFVLDEGRTALMPVERATEWLTLASPTAPLKRLRLVKQLVGEYRELPDWEEIESELAEHFNFRHTISAAGYLEALAARTEPVHLVPDELIEVRRLLDATGSVSLGHRLGRIIELDAIQYRRGRRVTCRSLASNCYLPKAIAKDKSGAWARAAEGVEGIIWASPSYALSLRGARGRAGLSLAEREKGPRRFLQGIGCEIAPRLVPLSTQSIIRANLPPAQLAILPYKATRLVDDFEAPDLDRVFAAMTKMKKRDMSERSFALFGALSASWSHYADRTMARAEWDERRRIEHVKVPATWLARAKAMPWLLNGKRQVVSPPGLAIGTDVNKAIYGNDPERIALGLTEVEAASGLPQALGMLVTPDSKELIAQLRRLKQNDRADWEARGAILMRALAERCDRWRPSASRTTIDGLLLTEIRDMLEADQLIYLTRYNDWAKPSELLLGRDIFRGRRKFVQASGSLGQLWKTIQIRTVRLHDCLSVIDEIGDQKEYSRTDEGVLLEAFQQVEKLLSSSGEEEIRHLARLPLWTGERFHRTRPVFVTSDPDLANALSGSLRFWKAPFDPMARPNLLKALKVTVLGPESLRVVGCDYSNEVPLDIAARYRRAVALMKNRLAREDDTCYRAARWDQLEKVVLATADTLALEVEVHVGRGELFSQVVPVVSHAEESDSGIFQYYQNFDVIGSDAHGGRLVAANFEGRYRMQASTLWFWAWSQAEEEEETEALELAEEDAGDDNASLEALAAASMGAKRKKAKNVSSGKTDQDEKKSPEPPKPAPVILKLKPTDHLTTAGVSVANSAAKNGGQQGGQPSGLKKNLQLGGRSGQSGSAGNGGSFGNEPRVIKGYTTTELEDAAFDVLQHLFNGGDESLKAELYDFRKERGIGSDMVVGTELVRQWVEVKSFSGDAPASVSLTRTEFSRAREEGAKFYLAVVSGLAEGYKTVVRLYRNPVVTVPWAPSGAVTFGGLGKAKCLECVLEHGACEPEDEASGE